MKKKNVINKKIFFIFLMVAIILFSYVSVSAAFVFNRTINGEAEVGKISLSDQKYLQYGYAKVADTAAFDSDTCYYTYDSSSQEYKKENLNEAKFNEQKNNLYVRSSENPKELSANNGTSLNCYATEKKGYKEELDYPYLNEIGFEFGFKNSIDVYLRIEFKDAWKSHKTYLTTGTVDERFIEKDKLQSGASPFNYSKLNDDDWIYDEKTNCAYYKYIIPANCVTITDETTQMHNYNFRINPNYWYAEGKSSQYREMIIVEVSYSVSLVQANRAENKWEVSFSDLGVVETTKPVSQN